MERSANKVIRAKQKTKTKFKVLGFFKMSVETSIWITEITEAPDYIEGVFERIPDDIVEDVSPDQTFDDQIEE